MTTDEIFERYEAFPKWVRWTLERGLLPLYIPLFMLLALFALPIVLVILGIGTIQDSWEKFK